MSQATAFIAGRGWPWPKAAMGELAGSWSYTGWTGAAVT